MVPVTVMVVIELHLLQMVGFCSPSPVLFSHGLPGLHDVGIGLALGHEAIAGKVAAGPVVVKLPVAQADPAKLMKTLRNKGE